MKKKYDWKLLQLSWMQRNLMRDLAKPYTYAELGEEFNIPHKTIRNRAAKEKWQDRLAAEREKIEQQILSTILASRVESEAEVRQRQAHIAKSLVDKALTKIKETKVENLSLRQAIEILKFAMPEERKALGLSDKYEGPNIQEKPVGEYLTVEERKQRMQQADLLADKLFNYLNEQSVLIDTTSNLLK